MIRNIWAVGRNYADHAKELGNELPSEPMIFLKAGSTATENTEFINLPPWTQDVHHEVELALRFDDTLQISSAAVALDLTERTRQNQLKAKGHPWTLAKSFAQSCPLSKFFPVKMVSELQALEIQLKINGEVRQHGFTSQMIFPLEQLIDFVKFHFPVMPGDLLLTGTPAGVGPIKKGDVLEAELVTKIKHRWVVSQGS